MIPRHKTNDTSLFRDPRNGAVYSEDDTGYNNILREREKHKRILNIEKEISYLKNEVIGVRQLISEILGK